MIPHVVLGIAFLRFFTLIGLGGTFLGLVLAHIVIVFPFALRLTLASAIGMDRAIEQAAMSLGASDWIVFRRITLPLILPGVISGWALAFIQSFDEVTMTVFIAAPGTETLPVRMFLYIQDNIDPLVTSVSACVIALTTHRSDGARPRLRPRPAAVGRGSEEAMMREAARRDFDVAVVGGGLVGAAHRLGPRPSRPARRRARRGRRRRARLARQLRAGVGAEQGAGPARVRRLDHPLVRRLGRASPQTLEIETGLDVAFQRPGGFHLALSEAELEAARLQLKRLHNQPGIARLQDRDPRPHAASRRCCPASGPTWSAAATARSTATCNSLRLLRALHTGAATAAATTCRATASTTIEHERRRVPADARRTARSAPARSCSPPATPTMQLAPMVGLAAPMKPEPRPDHRHRARRSRFLRHPVVTIRQTDEGTVMIGDSQEDGTDARRHDHAGQLRRWPTRAVRMFPLLARLNVVRTWSGIRVMTQDGFPIYDQSETLSRRVRRLLPFRRDARRQPRLDARADDRRGRARR